MKYEIYCHQSMKVIREFSLDGEITGFSYDAGRLDIDGLGYTLIIFTNDFCVRKVD